MIDIIILVLVTIGAVSIRYYGLRRQKHDYYSRKCPPPELEEGDVYMDGQSMRPTHEELHNFLQKHLAYYAGLDQKLKKKFRTRVHKFMWAKSFIVKDKKAEREMAVLISAAAVQLCFGLKHFRLPFYKYIIVYPQEYFSSTAFLTVAGNVENNRISIAWNQLLKSYEDASDGFNTPLHEMAHALYRQKMIIDEGFEDEFKQQFHTLHEQFRLAYNHELTGQRDFYSEYAETNPQEFWAESVEMFFEKPHGLQSHYPEVYQTMRKLLQQDPSNAAHPLIKTKRDLLQKINDLLP